MFLILVLMFNKDMLKIDFEKNNLKDEIIHPLILF